MRSVFNDLLFRFVTVLTMLHQDKNLYSTRAWVGFSLNLVVGGGEGSPAFSFGVCCFFPLSPGTDAKLSPSEGLWCGGLAGINPALTITSEPGTTIGFVPLNSGFSLFLPFFLFLCVCVFVLGFFLGGVDNF